MNIPINLAVEDSLSEAVARKILYQSDNNYNIANCLSRRGCGYLKSKMKAFNEAAMVMPFLVLIDQDNGCPPEKVKKWLKHKANPKLIFRIAVMEIEAWVMADRKAISSFLSIPITIFPTKMDDIKDPKQCLLNFVKKSRSKILIDDIVPKHGSTAKVGPNYNACLSEFVRKSWDVYEAIKYSESLRRAFYKIQTFTID